MGTETTFGKEFDSLADMVAFGIAPAVVCYQWGVERIAEYGSAWGRFGWIAAFFYAAAVGLRLARFNSRAATADKRYFEGLPSPSGAALVAAFVALAHEFDVTELLGLVLAFAITLLAAVLMVSRFPYRSFKDRATGERVRYSKLLLVPVAIALIASNPSVVLFVMFGVYALSGPVGWSWMKLRRRPRDGGAAGKGG
jgi:CDP-diacylglycerol--serine O-phosphatidyltransferase